jgi:Flp pilus assembly protein TadG
MTRHRTERGSITLELALALPIVLVLLVGVIEWGWLLAREVELVQVAREAAHHAALTAADDDPEAAATARATADLLAAGFDPDLVDIEATVVGSDVGDVIQVRVSCDYEALLGLLPVPPRLAAGTTMLLEIS